MKQLIALLIFAAGLQAQPVAVNLGSVNVPAEVRDAIERYRFSQAVAIRPITVAVNASATVLNVGDTSAFNAGDQILLDDEAMPVASKTANTLTVNRGASITVAAPHAAGTMVRKCQHSNAVAMLKDLLRTRVVNELILGNTKPATITTLEAEIAARQAAIETFRQTTVQ